MSVNDTIWDILDKMRLATLFDEHGIPPSLFPLLAIILISTLLIFLTLPLFDSPVCGDSICSPSEVCPEDCDGVPSSHSKTVRVEIFGNLAGDVELVLLEESGHQIASKSTMDKEVIFDSVELDSAKVRIINQKTKAFFDSDLIDLSAGENLVSMGIPPNFFTSYAAPEKGRLVVSIYNSSDEPISADAYIYMKNGNSRIPLIRENVSATGKFDLDGEYFYQVLVTKQGYEDYIRPAELLQTGQTLNVTARLSKLPEIMPEAYLEACLKDHEDEPIMDGSLALYYISGELIATHSLDPDGCAEFNLNSTSIVTLATQDLPIGCMGVHSNDIMLMPGNQRVDLQTNCDYQQNGFARIKILDKDNNTLTQYATITAWYANNDGHIYGSGYQHTLAMGNESYTEYLSIPSGERFYFIISGLDGYPINRTAEFVLSPTQYLDIIWQLGAEEPKQNVSCGDGVCSVGESCTTCPQDCGECTPSISCGDGTCNGMESCTTCPQDCGSCDDVCGNGVCDTTENCWTCAIDCEECIIDTYCGDAQCAKDENCGNCPADCGTCPEPPKELDCGSPGDLNGDGNIEETDVAIISKILDDIKSSGSPQPPTGEMSCVDVDNDTYITAYDRSCLEDILSGEVDNRYQCNSCVEDMKSYGKRNEGRDARGNYWRYTVYEICNDGMDNDCNGLLDSEHVHCECDSGTFCLQNKDLDGLSNTNDLAQCRSYGSLDFSTMQATWGSYEWKDQETMDSHECSHRGASSWGDTERCYAPEWWSTCLLKYPKGFSMSDDQDVPGNEYFGAVGEKANAGPLGVVDSCGSSESCPPFWTEIDTSTSGDCNCREVTVTRNGRQTTEEVCDTAYTTYCRYRFDPCIKYSPDSKSCGSSGTSGQNEVCPQRIACMGKLADY